MLTNKVFEQEAQAKKAQQDYVATTTPHTKNIDLIM